MTHPHPFPQTIHLPPLKEESISPHSVHPSPESKTSNSNTPTTPSPISKTSSESNSNFNSPTNTALKTKTKLSFDILVIGAGPIGCAIAITFARQGRKVLLLEKSWKEPDRIVGELLQPGGVLALGRLGLEGVLADGTGSEDGDGKDDEGESELGIRIKGYEVWYERDEGADGEKAGFLYPKIEVDIPDSAGDGKRELKRKKKRMIQEGRAFRHGKFLMRLRELAKKEGNITVMEGAARKLIHGKGGKITGVKCKVADGEEQTYHAPLTILTTGQSTPFRTHLYPAKKPTSTSRFFALSLKRPQLPNPNLAYGIIGRGPLLAGLYQTSHREARLLIDISNTLHEDLKHTNGGVPRYIREKVIPALPTSVHESVERALEEGKLKSVPNCYLPAILNTTPGIMLLGDAMNMRHPLTGSGMTVGFMDVVLLSRLLSPEKVEDLGDMERVKDVMRVFHTERKKYCLSLNVLAQLFYRLFGADDPHLSIFLRGILSYIRLGPSYYSVPAGLLGGIHHDPRLLFYHVFAIAIYSMWLFTKERLSRGFEGLLGLPVLGLTYLWIFMKVVCMIGPTVWNELRC